MNKNIWLTFFIVCIISLVSAESESTIIFNLDLTNLDQFESFQETDYAYITQDDDQKVLKFSELSHYHGIITQEWITSESGNYWITIEFKGQAGQYTGSYLGYQRSDQENIQRTIGLDAAYNMDLYQIFAFKSVGDWNTYTAYITVPKGVKLKLILEQGDYFGLSQIYSAEFRKITVWDMTFSDECPGTDNQEKYAYFTFLFTNMELKHKVFGDYYLESSSESTGNLKFQYPGYNSPCIKTAFYAFDANGNVIEKFDPDYQQALDLMSTSVDVLDTYNYPLSMSELESFNCSYEETKCQSDDQCKKYTCPISFHFYYDDQQFNFDTKQQEYEYTKENSQAIFNSSFSVVFSKETVVATAFQVGDLDSVCTGFCVLNNELELEIQMKNAENSIYEASNEIEIVWGQQLYFQIKGEDVDYELTLIGVITITEDETIIYTQRQSFIDQFVEVIKSEKGLLEFKMNITGETEINPDKPSKLAFLVKADSSRRLLEDDEFPEAAIASKDLSFYSESLGSAVLTVRYTVGIFAIILIIFIQSI